jgi:hypothetical protein
MTKPNPFSEDWYAQHHLNWAKAERIRQAQLLLKWAITDFELAWRELHRREHADLRDKK